MKKMNNGNSSINFLNESFKINIISNSKFNRNIKLFFFVLNFLSIFLIKSISIKLKNTKKKFTIFKTDYNTNNIRYHFKELFYLFFIKFFI